jgi:hypothetical protein
VSETTAKRRITRLRPRRGADSPRRLLRDVVEYAVQAVLFLAGSSSVVITADHRGRALLESLGFFRHVNAFEFLTGTT